MNTKSLTKYYNKCENAVNINFGASSKSAFRLRKSSTRFSNFHVMLGCASTELCFNITS